MKKIILLAMLTTLSVLVFAETTPEEKAMSSRWGLKISGYVNPHLWLDTRQTEGGRDGQLILWPSKPNFDADGKDINASPSFNMLGITSRFGLAFSTPDVLSANVSGYLEADFSGSVNLANNSFRLRHAYINFDWEKTYLLFGQFWHPLVVHEIMPSVAPLNTGAPFHPYARHMQIRYGVKFSNFNVFVAAITQRDNTSDGPDGMSAEYMKNAVIPNMHLQVQYQNGSLFAGLAGDMKILQPRLFTSIDTLPTKKTNTKLYSFTASAFAKYNFTNWDIKFQALWAQNQSDNLMLGGYAEIPVYDKNEYRYVNSNTASAWLNISKTTGKWRPGLFLGYAKNLGFQEELSNGYTPYGRGVKNGQEVDYLWRVQPRLSYKATDRLDIYSDIEYTAAGFGDVDSRGIVKTTDPVGNTRFMLGIIFLF